MALPNVYNALKGWEQDVVLIKTTTIEIDIGQYQTVTEENPFKAVVQPLSGYTIALKPQEQRAFEWIQLHVRNDAPIILNVGDRVFWLGKYYKILNEYNYSNAFVQPNQQTYNSLTTYGIMEYHACEINVNNNTSYAE